MRRIAPVLLLAAVSVAAAGQDAEPIRIEVGSGGDAVAGAEVIVAGTSHVTDATGVALVLAPPGAVAVTVVRDGFVPVTVTVPPAPAPSALSASSSSRS